MGVYKITILENKRDFEEACKSYPYISDDQKEPKKYPALIIDTVLNVHSDCYEFDYMYEESIDIFRNFIKLIEVKNES